MLALDVGNTHTVVGVHVGGALVHDWRIATRRDRTADETRLILAGLLAELGLALDDVEGIALSSVVPEVTRSMTPIAGRVPLFVATAKSPLSFRVDVPLPSTVGADRLVNAEAAIARHGAPVLVVDAGTATTFCCISADRRYMGGAIAPGLSLSAEALFARASKLAAVDLSIPASALANTTEAALISGIVLGHASMVDGMVGRLIEAMGPRRPRVVATGGVMDLLAGACRTIDVHDPTLTLEGLFLLYCRWRRQVERA